MINLWKIMCSSSFLPALKEMTIAAACASPGGGRNLVTPRFIRHFSVLCLPTPSVQSLQQIINVRRHTYYVFTQTGS